MMKTNEAVYIRTLKIVFTLLIVGGDFGSGSFVNRNQGSIKDAYIYMNMYIFRTT